MLAFTLGKRRNEGSFRLSKLFMRLHTELPRANPYSALRPARHVADRGCATEQIVACSGKSAPHGQE